MSSGATVRRRIVVRGTVQGVGFRPFAYRIAVELGLTGFVGNDAAGVLLEVEGAEPAVLELCRRVTTSPPPLAIVARVEVAAIAPVGSTTFTIVASTGSGDVRTPVGVDTATCAACLAEVDDPSDRRHRYPFTNCTDCGPRYTIVRRVPYDRPTTTMAGFTMCERCRAEYDDPADRRFHAQPNACPECGPQLRWCRPGRDEVAAGDAALRVAVAALQAGEIVAVKGVGGYHLACDATNGAAVRELRRRKARDDKPFAVLVGDLDTARALCDLDADACASLTSPQRPIVLAPRHASGPLAPEVAPGLRELGLLLPYSPLHHLLARDVGRPLVLTSGNLSDDPIAHDDADALAHLASLVDGFLLHDRPIHIRCDDSVVRSRPGRGVQVLRRSRGMAPRPHLLPVPTQRPVLAVGAELKSTVAVTVGDSVVASHHIGDLEHLAAYQSFLQAIDHLCRLYDVRPEVVAHDLHPEHLSTKLALEMDLEPCGVQHHHAHIASCMVDNGREAPVVGLAFDGLGYGSDGTLWGGEVLVADLRGFERVGHLAPVTMPGGAAAIREPWRMAVSWAHAAGVTAPFDDPRAEVVASLVARGHGPTTTSMGRLFDAVAALLGLRLTVTFEGQAAIALEAAASGVDRKAAPAFPVDICRVGGHFVLDAAPMVAAIISARAEGAAVPMLAAAFHESIGRAAVALAAQVADAHGLDTVALSGGVFQNARLGEIVEDGLAAQGLAVLVHRHIPPNDGGVSIGQAAVAAARTSSH